MQQIFLELLFVHIFSSCTLIHKENNLVVNLFIECINDDLKISYKSSVGHASFLVSN